MNFLDDNPRNISDVLGLVYVPELGFYTEEGEVVAQWDFRNSYVVIFRRGPAQTKFWSDNKILDEIWLGSGELLSFNEWQARWERDNRRSKYATGAATF